MAATTAPASGLARSAAMRNLEGVTITVYASSSSSRTSFAISKRSRLAVMVLDSLPSGSVIPERNWPEMKL